MGRGERRSQRRRDPGHDRRRGRDRHLLPGDRADRQLQAIDRTGRAAAGVRRDVRRQDRVGAQDLGHRERVGVQVQQPPDAGHGRRQVARVAERERHPHGGPVVPDLRDGRPRGEAQGPAVRGAVDLLHARDRARAQERQQRREVERVAAGQPQLDRHRARCRRPVREVGPGGSVSRGVSVAAVAQLGRGDRVDLADRLVELAQAREAGRERDVRDGQVGGLQERACHARALRPGQRERRRAQVVDEDPPQLPLPVAQAVRQAGHALAVHEALVDEAHRAAGHVAAQVPLRGARRGARDAALARPEPGALRGRGRGVEADAVALRGHGRAARPAVDAGARDRGEEVAVEPAIAAGDGAVVALERRGPMP